MTGRPRRVGPRGHMRSAQRGASTSVDRLPLIESITPGQAKSLADCQTKVAYTARFVADTAATALAWAGITVRSYRCPWCDLWHLTKKGAA